MANLLMAALHREGYHVSRAVTASQALDTIAATATDIVVVDLDVPDQEATAICSTLRAAGNVAVILVIARSDDVELARTSDSGADEYLYQPFGIDDLTARLNSALSRHRSRSPQSSDRYDRQNGAADGERPPEGSIKVGPLELDLVERRATLHGHQLDLTTVEFDLLTVLARQPGSTATRSFICEQVWPDRWYGPSKVLDAHVAHLRRKLGEPAWIQPVHVAGFRLVEQPPTHNASEPHTSPTAS